MNWKTLIADLLAAGKTQEEITTYCDCSQARISALLKADVVTEPRHALGEKLKQMHKDVMRAAA